MTKTKSTKRIKVMAIVMALSIAVCGIAVGVSAKTRRYHHTDKTKYNIANAEGAYAADGSEDDCENTPYQESDDITKVLDKVESADDKVGSYFDPNSYCRVMSPSHINPYGLYLLHAKWVFDPEDQIYVIDFIPDPKNPATCNLLQYNSERHYLKKFLNRDDLTPEQIEKIKNFKYPEGF